MGERSSPGPIGKHMKRPCPRRAAHPGPSAGGRTEPGGCSSKPERAATLARLRTLRIEFDGVVARRPRRQSRRRTRPRGSDHRVGAGPAGEPHRTMQAPLWRTSDEACSASSAGHRPRVSGGGGTIAAERLEARPGTRECIRCAWFGRTALTTLRPRCPPSGWSPGNVSLKGAQDERTAGRIEVVGRETACGRTAPRFASAACAAFMSRGVAPTTSMSSGPTQARGAGWPLSVASRSAASFRRVRFPERRR